MSAMHEVMVEVVEKRRMGHVCNSMHIRESAQHGPSQVVAERFEGQDDYRALETIQTLPAQRDMIEQCMSGLQIIIAYAHGEAMDWARVQSAFAFKTRPATHNSGRGRCALVCWTAIQLWSDRWRHL